MSNTKISQKILEQLSKEKQQLHLNSFEKNLLELIDKFTLAYWRFSLKDKILFLKQLAYLLKWWVSITEAIDTIKNSTENKIIKHLCEQIHYYLVRWEKLSRILLRSSFSSINSPLSLRSFISFDVLIELQEQMSKINLSKLLATWISILGETVCSTCLGL